MAKRAYVVGLDLGQARDYTALAVVERRLVGTGERRKVGERTTVMGRTRPLETVAVMEEAMVAHYDVSHLERLPLGTAYPAVAARAGAVLAALRGVGASAELVVDATGVGRPVVDLLRAAGLAPTAVTIAGGEAATREAGGYRVPKRDLVGALQVLLQQERLHVAQGLPEAATLVPELLDFRVKLSDAGHDSYAAWREGSHDDLVLAVALAVWRAERAAAGPAWIM